MNQKKATPKNEVAINTKPNNNTNKRFTVFNSHKATTAEKHISWNELLELLKNPSIGKKDNSKLIVPFISEGKTKEHSEKADHFAIVLDHDHDNRSMEEVISLYEPYGVAMCAYSTSSHLQTDERHPVPEKRWKVVTPLSSASSADQIQPISEGLAILFGSDAAQARKQQGFYAPNKLSEFAPYEYFEDCLNPLLDINDFEHPLIKDALTALESKRIEEAQTAPPKRLYNSSMDNSIFEKTAQAYSIESLLIEYGYKQRGKAWLAPSSESGKAGVYLFVDDNGKQRVFSHHGSRDPLSSLNHNGKSLDCFDVICALKYSGDTNEAIKHLVEELDSDGQKDRQKAFAQEKAQKETNKALGITFDDRQEPTEKTKFDFKAFSLNGKSKEMRLQMLDDKFVLGQMAIFGQATAYYAKPNSGKTLLTICLLIEAIKKGEIKADDVFYINADDNYKGLVTKLEIAEKYGFNMLAPSFNGFEASKFMDYLSQLILTDDAKGKVLILDTLKKFTNIMDKKVASDFGVYMRSFVSKGGTIIMLAHTNKHRDDEGKVVFSGTSDIVDDVDCAYTIDVSENGNQETKTIIFENIKSRGDVAKEAVYSYLCKASNYQELIDSVKGVSDEDAEEAKRQKVINDKLGANSDGIEAIIEAIETGFTLKTELIETAYKSSGISKKKIAKILKEHTGRIYLEGHRWKEIKGEKNTKQYEILFPISPSVFSPSVKSYKEARDGAE